MHGIPARESSGTPDAFHRGGENASVTLRLVEKIQEILNGRRSTMTGYLELVA